MLGAESVCWSAAFGHVTGPGCRLTALPSPAMLSVQTGPFPALPEVLWGLGPCFKAGFLGFPS